MSAPRPTTLRTSALLVALALVLLAAGARLFRGGEPFQLAQGVRVSDPDATYHLRRAERMRDGFPTLAIFDPFLNAPRGAVVPWPPLWDLGLAAALRVAPSDPATGFVRPAVAALPPLVAALGVLAVFALARRLLPGRLDLAAAAAGVAALVAADRPWTGFGRLDHAAAELALWCALVASLAGALAKPSKEGWLDRRALLPAALFALGLATQAALLVAAIVPLVAMLLLPADARRAMPRFLATFWGSSALLPLPIALAYASAGAPIAHTHFGLFQPALLGCAALAAASAALGMTGERRWRRLAIPLAALSLTGLFLLSRELLAGLGFVGRTSPWIASIGESRSPFAGGAAAGFAFALRELSPLVLLLPFGLVGLVRRARRGEGVAAVAFAALSIATILAAAQARFAGYLGLLVGFAAVVPIARWLERRALVVRSALLAALLAVVVFPQVGRGRTPGYSERALDRSAAVLDDLRHRAAETPERERGVVLAEWSFGHFVQYYGRHPAVVDNFGDFVGDLALPRQVLLAEDEESAERLLAARSARYLLVGPLAETLSGLLASESERDRYVAASRPAPDGSLAVDFRPAVARTLLYRASRQLGTAVFSGRAGFVPPLRGLRLVAESAAVETLPDGRRVPAYKLFERVPGARLRSAGWRPGDEVRLEGTLRSPSGLEFPWLDVARADARGVVELRFPYATEATAEGRALGLALRSEAREVRVESVSESAVRAGSVLELAARPGLG